VVWFFFSDSIRQRYSLSRPNAAVASGFFPIHEDAAFSQQPVDGGKGHVRQGISEDAVQPAVVVIGCSG
jgi:hypothetical protein